MSAVATLIMYTLKTRNLYLTIFTSKRGGVETQLSVHYSENSIVRMSLKFETF